MEEEKFTYKFLDKEGTKALIELIKKNTSTLAAYTKSFRIETTDWHEGQNGDYSYYADIVDTDVKDYNIADVTFDIVSVSVAGAASVATVNDTGNGYIRLFSKNVPESVLTGIYCIMQRNNISLDEAVEELVGQVGSILEGLDSKVNKEDGKGLSTNDFTTEEKNLLSSLNTTVSGLTTEIGTKVDKVEGKGLSTNDYTTEEKELLSSLNTTVGNISAALSNKVEKEDGRGLSTNDYTTAEKNKLNAIAEGAEVNVQSDWNETNTSADSYIQNKPDVLVKSDISDWAKAANKPSYTASEVNAEPSGAVSTHNSSTSAHSDIRNLISSLSQKVTNFLDTDDTTMDQLSELITAISNNQTTIGSLTTNKVNVGDIINNLTSTATNKPLSAAQGKALKDLYDGLGSAAQASSLDFASAAQGTKADNSVQNVKVNGTTKTKDSNGAVSLNIPVPATFTIAANAWTQGTGNNGSDGTTSKYKYYADITASGATANDSANVSFDLASLDVCSSVGVAPACDVRAGKIRIFSESAATSALSGVYIVIKGA